MTAAPSWPRVLLRSEDSEHHLSVIETAPAPGVSPPLHSHDFDETFYVMEGELIFQVRDEYFTVRAGQLAFAPRGVPHTYANLSGAPAHQIDHLYAGRVRALLRAHGRRTAGYRATGVGEAAAA
jgi:quercetin dioxygenase-like cupin family protein